ncbi:hypothetical protein C8J57DRAFT_1718746 [Mycena rebaudengoi]|nr:hypothetical protein C8J57DRAFT_1718746 [Mycena rebaudengoi]
MFFSASIAFTLLLSFTGVVQGAPLATTRAPNPPPIKACTGINGTGDCTILNVSINNGSGVCTNVSNAKSLVLNIDNSCVSFPKPNCDFDVTQGGVAQFFPSDSSELPDGILSFECNQLDGIVDGLFPE